MMAVRAWFPCLFVVALLAIGCNTPMPPHEVSKGRMEKSVYRNDYFGFKVAIPPDWHAQDKETQKQMNEIGTEAFSGSDKNLESAIRASQARTADLFSVNEHPLDSLVASNPGIICVAEMVYGVPGVKTGEDYLLQVKRTLKAGQMNYSFPSETISTESVGGKDFSVLSLELQAEGVTVRQEYYVAVMKGYALSFILSYQFDEEKARLEKVLDTVKFQASDG